MECMQNVYVQALIIIISFKINHITVKKSSLSEKNKYKEIGCKVAVKKAPNRSVRFMEPFRQHFGTVIFFLFHPENAHIE